MRYKSRAFQTNADIASLRSFVLQDSIDFRYSGHLLQNHDLMSRKIKGVDSTCQCLFRVNFVTDSVVWEGELTLSLMYMFLGTRSFTTSHGGGGGGTSFWKCTECEGGSYGTGLLCKSCQTVLWLKQIHVSFKRRTKKFTLAVLCKQLNITRVKLGPGSYQLFLLPGM